MNVYQCISKVQAALAKTGIAKDRQCQQGASFKYRGIDEVYNTLAPLLSSAGLCILPRIVSRHCDERLSGAGKALFYVIVEAEFDMVSAEDGTKHTIRTYGEAMDSGDKATNKAMSIAYKNAIFMAFSVPTEGDNDPDAQAHDVAPPSPSSMPNAVVAEWIDDMRATTTEAELKAVFGTAWKYAGQVGDAKARSTFKSEYDKLTGERKESA